MAGSYRRTGSAAANGFEPRNLLCEQSAALAENGYPMPPDMHVGSRFVISVRGNLVQRLLAQANRNL